MSASTALTATIVLLAASTAMAGQFAAPGDLRLRHDLQLLDDAGLTNVPLTTWPLAWHDVVAAIDGIDPSALGDAERLAYERVRRVAAAVTASGQAGFRVAAAAAIEPRVVRTFDDTPRDEEGLTAGIDWAGSRVSASVRLTAAANPDDGEEFRADATYLGVELGNWLLSAGWQQRWWGPGHDGSLILSGNARPMPALAIQRRYSTAFESRWLRWIGPWTFSSFIGLLDDDRTIDDTLLFGARAAFRPIQSLEIGLSRTAQWCGDGRPCDGSAFVDLLLGNDNRGINVNPEDEPGNQLAGVDARWSAAGRLPLAVYAQWIGEDSRNGGPEIGSWLRLAGIEYFGSYETVSYRTHIEIAETSCRDGGLGFSSNDADCAYEHGIYRDGYRYRNRSLGHGMDSDGLSVSLGSTLVQSAGHNWSVSLRLMDINRIGQENPQHSLSQNARKQLDIQITHDRILQSGTWRAGIGFQRVEDDAADSDVSEVTGFIQWSMP